MAYKWVRGQFASLRDGVDRTGYPIVLPCVVSYVADGGAIYVYARHWRGEILELRAHAYDLTPMPEYPSIQRMAAESVRDECEREEIKRKRAIARRRNRV